jgi:hypothetical protein
MIACIKKKCTSVITGKQSPEPMGAYLCTIVTGFKTLTSFGASTYFVDSAMRASCNLSLDWKPNDTISRNTLSEASDISIVALSKVFDAFNASEAFTL